MDTCALTNRSTRVLVLKHYKGRAVSVCLSVCLSQAGVATKRLNGSSRLTAFILLAQWFMEWGRLQKLGHNIHLELCPKLCPDLEKIRHVDSLLRQMI